MLKEFWPTGAGGGIADELVLESVNGLRPADYYVDANVAYALVAQAINATQDLLPGRGKFWAMVVLSAVQGVTAVLAHFADQDLDRQ